MWVEVFEGDVDFGVAHSSCLQRTGVARPSLTKERERMERIR